MQPPKIHVVLMIAHLPEQRIRVERRATGCQLSIGCTQRKQDCIIKVLVVSGEVDLIPPNPMKRVPTYSIGVVWKSLNHTTIRKRYFGFLHKQTMLRKVPTKTCHSSNVELSLAPTWSHKTNVQISVVPSVSEMQRADICTFSCLTWPTD